MKSTGDQDCAHTRSWRSHALGLTTGLLTTILGFGMAIALATDTGLPLETEGYLAGKTMLLVYGTGIAAAVTSACWGLTIKQETQTGRRQPPGNR